MVSHCAQLSHPPTPGMPRRAISPGEGLLFPSQHHHTFSSKGAARLSFTAHSLHSPISLSRVAWSILDCARRTSTFLSCAFRGQEDDQATLPYLFCRSNSFTT